MNEKNSLGLDKCFLELDNPILLFTEWYNKAKITEINDPNALALGTIDEKGYPNVRMVLLKDYGEDGFVFYTNFNSCLLYTSPSPRDIPLSRMPSSA